MTNLKLKPVAAPRTEGDGSTSSDDVKGNPVLLAATVFGSFLGEAGRPLG